MFHQVHIALPTSVGADTSQLQVHSCAINSQLGHTELATLQNNYCSMKYSYPMFLYFSRGRVINHCWQ